MTTARDYLRSVLTPTDMLSVSPDGRLMVEGCAVDDLVRQYGSPLFIHSEQTLRANFRRVKAAVEACWPAPSNVMFAIKSNTNLAVRAVLDSEGAGGDCFGFGEMIATFTGGADPSRICLNGSNKSPELLRLAAERDVLINMDDPREIPILEEIQAELGKPVRVNIRLKVVPDALSQMDSDYLGGVVDFSAALDRKKWGVLSETAIAMVRRVQESNKLTLLGYHTHFGRHSQKPADFAAFHGKFAKNIVGIWQATGFSPKLIDLGGGWPRTRDPESKKAVLNPYTIEDYIAAVTDSLRNEFESAGMTLPALWLEPGRYIAGNIGVLATTVGSIKDFPSISFVNVDASTNTLYYATVGGHYHILPVVSMDRNLEATYDIVGPICVQSTLGANRKMPELHTGDILAILDTGSYCEAEAQQLNIQPLPAAVMVNGTDSHLTRRAETYEELATARHSVPKHLLNTTARPRGILWNA